MKICIDPGHGMGNRVAGVFDPGAVHQEGLQFHREADIVLRYGLALREALRERGSTVVMTRDDATDPTPVGRRARMAQQTSCERLISLHLNDFDDDSANGIEVLYGRPSAKPWAQALQTRLVQLTGLRDRKIKQRSELAVLKFTGPAVLIELGFIANDQDRELILSAAMRDAIVQAIAELSV